MMVGSQQSHLGSQVGLAGSHLNPTCLFTWDSLTSSRDSKEEEVNPCITKLNLKIQKILSHHCTGSQLAYT